MTTETEVANRAIQRVGGELIAAGLLWSEDSRNANQLRTVFHSARRSELRRNVWRFSIRTELLRPRATDTRLITFPTWSALVDYDVNDIVVRNGNIWMAIAGGLNQDPDARTFTYWNTYFGGQEATEWDTDETYMSGEFVYVGTALYISIVNNNTGNEVTDTGYWQALAPAAYNAGTAYAVGDRVTSSGIVYACIQAGTGQTPASSPLYWTAITQYSLNVTTFIYPIGAGPSSSADTRNVYRLPNNFLREAPQAPKTKGLPHSDWQYEGNYFTTGTTGVIAFRFAADIENPNEWDPMFLDAFSARLGMEVCEILSQSTGKVQTVSAIYNKVMSEARVVNGIETGWIEPPEDDYITCRY